MVCWSTAALAQSASIPTTSAAGSDIVRLTDEQRMAILDGNTVESAAAARGELPDSEDARRGVHGEVGVMIGSHGARAVYGTADIPLGDHAGAVVSFESSSFGYQRQRPIHR
jgi:hypothetical protein